MILIAESSSIQTFTVILMFIFNIKYNSFFDFSSFQAWIVPYKHRK